MNHSVGPNDVSDSHKKKKRGCNIKPFLLMLALSVHSFFEGLACGLQMNLSQCLNIVIAIGVHKSIAGSSLGIALVRTFPNDFSTVRWCIFIFAMASPVGIFIGMVLNS